MVNKDLLDKIEALRNKPQMYHFVCFGNSGVKIIDVWRNTKTMRCPWADTQIKDFT